MMCEMRNYRERRGWCQRDTIFGLVIALVALTSCTERHTMGWPPPGAKVFRWDGAGTISGFELYVVRDSFRRSWGAARLAGSDRYLTGKDAFDAVRARTGDDPAVLAALVMLFLDQGVTGQTPWLGPDGSPRAREEQAIAALPALSGDVLEYWRFHEQLEGMLRCRATLSTGAIQCELATTIIRDRAMAENPMNVIERDLAADDIYERMNGIDALAGMNTPESRARLYDLALDQGHFRVREAAVKAIVTVARTADRSDGTAVATLSRILLHDGHPDVRRAAAVSLGTLADPAGHDALQRAAHGDADGRVRGEAIHALTLLK